MPATTTSNTKTKHLHTVMNDLWSNVQQGRDIVVDKLQEWNRQRQINNMNNHRMMISNDHLKSILALPLDLADLETTLDSVLFAPSSTTSTSTSSVMQMINDTTTASTTGGDIEMEFDVPSTAGPMETANVTTTTTTPTTLPSTSTTREGDMLFLVSDDPLTTKTATTSRKSPVLAATPEIPVALFLLVVFLRAAWHYQQHRSKIMQEEQQQQSSTTSSSHEEIATSSRQERAVAKDVPASDSSASSTNGDHASSTNGKDTSTTTLPVVEDAAAKALRERLEREAQAKLAIEAENRALQRALETHKSTVEKFQSELQSRNERLTIFEQEQEAVRRDLSAQIEVLKRELQERQSQEQGNLQSKEHLCNDLIQKIQTLNQDLEHHEQLWKGVAQKAQEKEAASVAKVESLQLTLRQEQAQRATELAFKEDECARLAAQVQAVESEYQQQKTHQQALHAYQQARETTEETLQQRLVQEQEHASALTNKLQVFSTELASRQEKVTSLNDKMAQVQRLSKQELDQLSQELQEQIQQRAKLQETAQEMTRMLQEKRDQCVGLSKQLESSQAELKALEDRLEALTKEVDKRQALATARIDALQGQLDQERVQAEECLEASNATNEELKKKQEEFVQLTTRMDLFLKELQFRDEQVASLETKMGAKEELATSEIKILRGQLQVQQERRDEWNATTASLEQLLKDKKAQVVGLTTRADLFERELQGRQERVAALQSKIQEREDAEAVKMEPYRNELKRLTEERDSWKDKTEEIARLLQERLGQTQGLKTRLHLFKGELAKKDERVAVLKNAYREQTHKTMVEIAPVREKLQVQREQLKAWTDKTEEIRRLLNQKRPQCIGLNTRVKLFQQELQNKDHIVQVLETKVADKQEVGKASIASLSKQVEEQTKARDEWRASTEKVHQLLAEKKKESDELTTELKELVSSLQSYQQRRANLESSVKERKEHHANQKTFLEEDLKAVEDHRDEWKEKASALDQTLKDTEQSIIGLQTRAMLFDRELQQRRETVANLEKQFQEMDEKSSQKKQHLRDEIEAAKKEHESWVEETLRLNKDLKDTKRQCIGLSTRLKLFTQELEKRQNLVDEQEAKINDIECEDSAKLEWLQNARSEKAKDRDDWKQKTEEIERLLNQTEGEVVGLGTRLELFMVQVMEHEENVSRAESRINSRRGFSVNPSFTKELEAAKEKRDEWTEKALEIERLLKTKKSQIPGLATRKTLFRVELSKRNEQVATLEAKIAEKQQLSESKIAPLRTALKAYIQQRDEWTTNTEKINNVLNEKQEECLPIAAALEDCIDRLTKCKERIDSLEEELREEECYESDKLASFKRGLVQQQTELRQWEDNTDKVHRLLREKRQGIHGLKTRITVFGGELRKREETVNCVKAKIAENDKRLTDELGSIHTKIVAEHAERDRIIETTLVRNQALKALEDTCRAMTVRCRLFEDELRSREERVTLLEAKLQEKEYDYSAQMKTLKAELETRRADRDKWRDTTQSIATLLKETERECVGLDTRLQLFMAEKMNYNAQVAAQEAKVEEKENESAERMAPYQKKLNEEQEDRDSWDKKTSELDSKLQETKREIIGLTTRSKLFKQELAKKQKGVTILSEKIKKDDDDFAIRMEPLVKEFKKHKEELDTWEQSTQKVKSMLEQTKSECSSIPTRLDLFRREQKIREDAVNELDGKIKHKEDLVAIQLGFLLNELQLQQKQRGKWKKVTLEMHRLLKETKEQVANLELQLESNQNALRERQERVKTMEISLRDGRDLVAQQLKTLRNEIEHQREHRDNLNSSCAALSRRLDEAKELCNDLSQKLKESASKVRSCTEGIQKLEGTIEEKKNLDSAQMESLNEQLKVHVEQRSEWEENTKRMKEQLKEKQDLCSSFKTKLALLKNMQNGEVRSSLATESNGHGSFAKPAQNGLSAHLSKLSTNGAGKKSSAEEALAAKMDSLEKELKNQKNEKLEVLASELLSL